MEVRVRMAPSPTGNLHLGTAYTTLFNYLFARRHDGKLILRFEDTDAERSKKEFEENIVDGLQWLGLQWDEGPYRQSERLANYQKAAERLLAEGKAYYCFCTPEELEAERAKLQAANQPLVYSGKCRNLSKEEVEEKLKAGAAHVVRFKMPNDRGEITFDDLLHGPTSFEAKLLGDMVIMRSNGQPLYNFTVVVDDIDMKISHVLRAEDHLSNTPKQIVLFEALGVALPQFAHWPSVLNPDRIGKLSKRQGAMAVSDYCKEGYLPEAIINYLALLGWTVPGDQEIVPLAEMKQLFDLKKMRLSGAAFDRNKLDWLNGEYIRQMSDEELTKRLEQFLVDHPAPEKIAPLVPLIKTRIKTLADFIPLTNFVFAKPEYDAAEFAKIKISGSGQKDLLSKIASVLRELPKPWQAEQFEKDLRQLAEKEKVAAGDLFQLLRVAVSGQLVTPPLFETMQLIGEDESITRVVKALDISAQSS